MADIYDYTQCAGCECSLCYIDHSWFTECHQCGSEICFCCLEKAGIVKNPKSDFLDEKDMVPPYRLITEDTDDDEIIELYEKYGYGFLGGCPYCETTLNKIDKDEFIDWLIVQIGKPKEQLEQEFRNK